MTRKDSDIDGLFFLCRNVKSYSANWLHLAFFRQGQYSTIQDNTMCLNIYSLFSEAVWQQFIRGLLRVC